MALPHDRTAVRRIFLTAWLVAGAVLAGAAAFGQQLDGRREQVTTAPEYRGTVANAPVPAELHTRNANPGRPGWGGCVPSSTRTAALYQRVPRDRVDAFWALAKREVGVGGTDRNLLASMLRRTMPDEPWVDYMGPDSATTLDHLSAKGYAMCSTMSWGDMYPGRIHHWVNPIHFDSRADLACFVDNNDPGRYHWTTAREFAARARDGGMAWIFAFTRLPAAAKVRVAIVASAVLVVDAAMLLAGGFGFVRFAMKV